MTWGEQAKARAAAPGKIDADACRNIRILQRPQPKAVRLVMALSKERACSLENVILHAVANQSAP